jgi:hypothetical protein
LHIYIILPEQVVFLCREKFTVVFDGKKCNSDKRKNMSLDTIFLCFCEDCEKNDGVDRPYYMSKVSMRGILSYFR